MDRSKRNTLLGLGGLAVAYGLLRHVPALRSAQSSLTLEPLAKPAGFRTLAGGPTSARMDAFAGISFETPEQLLAKAEADTRVAANPCQALYPDLGTADRRVPIASFSDYYCPFCKTQTQALADFAAQAPVTITWHEWPLFGERSEVSARAALAAAAQGAYASFHARLMGSAFHATAPYLTRVAEDIGIDPERLLADMKSPAIARRIADSTALARLLRLAGTPAVVIGRTVVQGEVDMETIAQVVALEQDGGWRDVCGV